ncbi:HD domain-containing protein [Streptococcus iniae]|uniref:HD domain-containing protein n=1 Tax=Streptococcus iniae TaxID=1346 RepID=UPI000EF6B737|nr:HD domain-containing protein [Streptococcus iniae]RLV19170.1 phosphohydrolase [Streptococcus iniae]
MLSPKEKDILAAAEKWVSQKLADDAIGHDWWHIVRVRNTAVTIAQKENANLFICQLAALLHDMTDEKLHQDRVKAEKDLKNWLEQQSLAASQKQQIRDIIESISFKAGHGKPAESIEAKVVQDADRLDAIGAIGIARCMAYSGHKGRLIHDPNRKARQNLSVDDYRNGKDTAIMHFYEKLLQLKDLMNTEYGYFLAQQRHAFLESYLEEFYAEWDGLR